MRIRTWICPVLIVMCLAVFFGYRAVDRMSSDTDAPEIRIEEGTLNISVNDDKAALLQGVTARDDRSGDVTSSLIVESVSLLDSDGTIRITYAAVDGAGNVTKAERTARYSDYRSPRFSLTAPMAFVYNSGFDALGIIGAEDPVDGDITHRIRATSLDERSISALGTHQVEFRVSNSLGETAKLTVPVEVYAPELYQASLSLTDYLVYLPQGASFDVEDYLDSYTLTGRTTSLRNGLPGSFALSTFGTVDTGTPGIYTVAYTVTYTRVNTADPSQNQSFAGYSKLIVVVEE